jgi:hypothetical protein
VFHSETDSQTERNTPTIEGFLKAFLNLDISDWVELMPMAEIANKNNRTTATGYSPFYVNYRFDPNPSTCHLRIDTLTILSKVYGHWMVSFHDDCGNTGEKTD